jgi:hypothetical protein
MREFIMEVDGVSRHHDRPSPNNPAAGKAGVARLLGIGHHRPGLPEPGRSANEDA